MDSNELTNADRAALPVSGEFSVFDRATFALTGALGTLFVFLFAFWAGLGERRRSKGRWSSGDRVESGGALDCGSGRARRSTHRVRSEFPVDTARTPSSRRPSNLPGDLGRRCDRRLRVRPDRNPNCIRGAARERRRVPVRTAAALGDQRFARSPCSMKRSRYCRRTVTERDERFHPAVPSPGAKFTRTRECQSKRRSTWSTSPIRPAPNS